jgi:DNA invertase Pin-like site-specific DNA recombinase
MIKPLAYSYIRMSTDTQLKGDSLRRQSELSRKYAAENGLELVENFNLNDIGVSAFRGDNVTEGNLGKFISAVEAGEIAKGSYLLVESLDRISRQRIGAAMTLFQRITAAGISIVTLTDGQIYRANEDDMAQMIVSVVIMSRAYEESETKSKRLSAAWENKRKNISKKVLTSKCPAWLEVKEDRSGYVQISSRVKIVKDIFHLAANGHGSHLITRKLNANKVKPFGKTNGWVESYVTKILGNIAVLGEFQPHRKVGGKRQPVGNLIVDYTQLTPKPESRGVR